MVVDIGKRLDIYGVLNHPWLKNVDVGEKKEKINNALKEKNT